MVEFAVPVDGLPILPGPQGDVDPNGTYVATVVLGATSATGIATVVEIPPFEPDVASGELGGLLTGDFGDPASFTGEAGTVADPPGSGARRAGSDEVVAGGASPRLVRAIDELFADRLRLVYLAFTLSVLALAVAPRLTLPARLPRSTL